MGETALVEAEDRTSPLRSVVLVIGQLQIGGTEGQVVLLAEGLRRRGIDVAVAVLFDDGPYAANLRDAGIDVYYASLPKPRRDGVVASAKLLPALARFTGWLRGRRPQVVHAFLYHAYVLTPLPARLAGAQVVAGRRSLGDFKNGSRALLAIERAATSLTTKVVANSYAVARDTLAAEQLAPGKLTVIPNGIPPVTFEPVEPANLGAVKSPIVVCVANLKKYKGHRELVDAAAVLARESLRCTLVFVGDGPERASLDAHARELGIDVMFLGHRRDVRPILAAADVVVLPSHGEGLSNSILEAMALGRSIVATDVGGNPEALGSTGLLVPPKDPTALADALKRVLHDEDLRRRLGAAARLRARTEFSADEMVERHVTLYEELLA